MATYKLNEEAEADLIRIHQWGMRRYGEAQADRYLMAFIDHFEELSKQPLSYPAYEPEQGTGVAFVGRKAFSTE